MNAIVDGRVFRSGDSAAVLLPDEVAFALGTEVCIERRGDSVIIRPRTAIASWREISSEEALANNRALVEETRAIWDAAGGPPPPQKRDADIFPDRPGLY